MEVVFIKGRGYDSNIYLLKDDLNLLIDAGTGKNFDYVKNEIEKSGPKIQDIDILMNTHEHFDHIGGNHRIVEASDCELMASEPTAKMLEEGDQEETLASAFGGKLEPMKVSRVLSEGDKIKLGESTLEILTTPGHSRGDIALYEPEEKSLFSGDTVFQGGIGRTDLPSSDQGQMKKSLQKLSELDVENLYPGHGPIVEGGADKQISRALKFLI